MMSVETGNLCVFLSIHALARPPPTSTPLAWRTSTHATRSWFRSSADKKAMRPGGTTWLDYDRREKESIPCITFNRRKHRRCTSDALLLARSPTIWPPWFHPENWWRRRGRGGQREFLLPMGTDPIGWSRITSELHDLNSHPLCEEE